MILRSCFRLQSRLLFLLLPQSHRNITLLYFSGVFASKYYILPVRIECKRQCTRKSRKKETTNTRCGVCSGTSDKHNNKRRVVLTLKATLLFFGDQFSLHHDHMLGGRHSGVIVWREMHLSNARQHDLCVADSKFLRDSKNSRVIRPIGWRNVGVRQTDRWVSYSAVLDSSNAPLSAVQSVNRWKTTANQTNKRKIFVVIREISSNSSLRDGGNCRLIIARRRRHPQPARHRRKFDYVPTDSRTFHVVVEKIPRKKIKLERKVLTLALFNRRLHLFGQ